MDLQSNITLVTTTYYADPFGTDAVRYHLACQTIGDALAQEVCGAVVVVDGSPTEVQATIARGFERLGAFCCAQQEPGMGPSRRQAFRVCDSRNGPFMWLEPEKADMVRLIPRMLQYMQEQELDVLVPERDPEIMDRTYPAPQVASERRANDCFREVTGRNLDIMFGPVLFRRSVLPLFANCNPAEDFNVPDGYIQHVAVMKALAVGKKVGGLRVPFYYPLQQRDEEELSEAMVAKRIWQYEVLTKTDRTVASALGLSR